MKSHYIYLAIGYDTSKQCNKLSLLCPLLRMQFYIGVRTGQLPDYGYKTSSYNRQWKYLAKVPLAIYSLREEANEDEIFVLKYLKQIGLWNMLANKAIAKYADQTGKSYKRLPQSAETKQKISASLAGRKQSPRTAEHRANLSASKKGKPSPNKGKKLAPSTAEHKAKTKATKLEQTHARLAKYGAIAIVHKEYGAILLADSQCILDFCQQTDNHLGK